MNALKTQMTHRMSTRQIMAMLLPLMAEQLLITMMGMVNTVMVTHVGPAGDLGGYRWWIRLTSW